MLFSEKEKSYFLSVLTYPWLLRSSEQLRALAGWLDCESLPLHIVFKTDYVSLFCRRGRFFFFHVLKKKPCLYAGPDLLPTVLWDVKASIFNSFAISLFKESN